MSGSNIAFVLTGSIAGYKACEAVSRLVQRGHSVRAVATESALRFVGAATLEGLTGRPVLTGLFDRGAAMDHIALTRWADVVVVCPATAHTLNRFAAGLADDLPGALFLAQDRTRPWLVAPAMNPAMWGHPATVAAVARLREWGVRFIPVGSGRSACGEVGEGRLAEPEAVVAAIEAALAPAGPAWRILVTSGGTAEPIDGVRVLTNTSTGATGAGLAAAWARDGHAVTLLRARHAVAAAPPVREETFGSFAELDAALGRLLGKEIYDVVVHAAAVGDFALAGVEVDGIPQPAGRGKLDSGTAPVLRLRPNPKLLETLRQRSRNPAVRIVAFKLTQGASPAGQQAEVRALMDRAAPDLVVHNDLAARAPGAFPADLYRADGTHAAHCAGREDLAPVLSSLLAPLLSPVAAFGPSSHAALP
jgi:phosphopantothenoylcysteine decarboxylase/phosphopantothenate--cysteine ligase